ncbi:hypothetical protein HB667_26595 [Bacillus cereus]|uniref:hypothetical protein n=1 Tax=Bacillus cereus TaxID=1396 RepID=UPI0014442BF6|nr:hypothetical protein [Bacillus cereus]NKW77383.1 hypothetical protein [Bacillus cereus]NKX14800.1 hypothetical protein [Bacillus cereus]
MKNETTLKNGELTSSEAVTNVKETYHAIYIVLGLSKDGIAEGSSVLESVKKLSLEEAESQEAKVEVGRKTMTSAKAQGDEILPIAIELAALVVASKNDEGKVVYNVESPVTDSFVLTFDADAEEGEDQFDKHSDAILETVVERVKAAESEEEAE